MLEIKPLQLHQVAAFAMKITNYWFNESGAFLFDV